MRFPIFSSKKKEDNMKANSKDNTKLRGSEARNDVRNYKSTEKIEQENKNEPEKRTEFYRKLQFYQNKLLQIDWKRSRSLNLARIYNKWCFDLANLMKYDNLPTKSIKPRSAIG
jgi:hypothetical protein